MSMAAIKLKQKIARRFSQAATEYDNAAFIQQQIADDALALLPDNMGHVLDIGCGSGRITQTLSKSAVRVSAVDLAEGMINVACRQYGEAAQWFVADAEALPFAAATFEQVFSSMALQWCSDFTNVLNEVYRVLTPGGSAVLALMSHGSFFELQHSWAKVDDRRHVNGFLQPDHLYELASALPFRVKLTNKLYRTFHPDIFSLLGSIKNVGANVVANSDQSPLTRGTLTELARCYDEQFRASRGLPLSYNVSVLQLSKPEENSDVYS